MLMFLLMVVRQMLMVYVNNLDDNEDKHDVVEVDNQMDFEVYQVVMVYTFEDEMTLVRVEVAEHRLMYRLIPIDYDHQMHQMVDKGSEDNMNIDHWDFALLGCS
jgi:hypothetical protein